MQWNLVNGWTDFRLEWGQVIVNTKVAPPWNGQSLITGGFNRCKINALVYEDLLKTDTGSNAKMNVNHFRRNVSNYATVVEDAICKALIAALIQVLQEKRIFTLFYG